MKKQISAVFLIILIIAGSQALLSQELTKDEKKAQRKEIRQEKEASGRLLITPLAGPAYTPELGFTIAGGIMTSFKTDRSDSLHPEVVSTNHAWLHLHRCLFYTVKMDNLLVK